MTLYLKDEHDVLSEEHVSRLERALEPVALNDQYNLHLILKKGRQNEFNFTGMLDYLSDEYYMSRLRGVLIPSGNLRLNLYPSNEEAAKLIGFLARDLKARPDIKNFNIHIQI
ncbi:MAG: hypothetical protein ACE5FT_00585 [Candidatus Nanoarchaeia archaeon]